MRRAIWNTSRAMTLVSGLLLVGACSPAAPDASATATTPTAAASPADTASPSPTPTPPPTGSTLGPVGTIAFQDDKVWLVTPEGDYTMNIPEGYEGKEPTPESTTPPQLVSSTADGSKIFYFHSGKGALPTADKLNAEFAFEMVNDPHVREDITKFAEHPAIAFQIQTIANENVVIYIYSKIGNTRWQMNFIGTSQEQADDLIRQASESLTKQ